MRDLAQELRTGLFVTPKEVADEIDRLRADLSKWKARAQVLRTCALRLMDWDQWATYDCPDAREWFDEDGVPRD